MPPTGTITFLFSDIEGSSRKWEEQPDAMRVALALHDRILREAFEARDGFVFKTAGDAFCVAFYTAQDAVTAALASQRGLHTADWVGIDGLKVRMALHTGAAEHRDGDYFGQAPNRVSRILSTGHGGQVLVSLPTQELVRDVLPVGVQLRHLGEHRLRDLGPEQIFQLVAGDLPSQFPALRLEPITVQMVYIKETGEKAVGNFQMAGEPTPLREMPPNRNRNPLQIQLTCIDKTGEAAIATFTIGTEAAKPNESASSKPPAI